MVFWFNFLFVKNRYKHISNTFIQSRFLTAPQFITWFFININYLHCSRTISWCSGLVTFHSQWNCYFTKNEFARAYNARVLCNIHCWYNFAFVSLALVPKHPFFWTTNKQRTKIYTKNKTPTLCCGLSAMLIYCVCSALSVGWCWLICGLVCLWLWAYTGGPSSTK